MPIIRPYNAENDRRTRPYLAEDYSEHKTTSSEPNQPRTWASILLRTETAPFHME